MARKLLRMLCLVGWHAERTDDPDGRVRCSRCLAVLGTYVVVSDAEFEKIKRGRVQS